MTAEGRTCPNCGGLLATNAPGGHCPACLFRIALVATEGDAPGAASAISSTAGGEQPGGLALGEQLGDYELIEKIGQGGMGVVYLAEQKQPIRRQVALKIIRPGLDTEQVVSRFEAERQALAVLDHPNIAKVLGAGSTGSGRPYFVMELVRGIKITDYCDQKQLATRLRLDLFLQVCGAVQHAHQKGIIHRDLKPSNILVSEQEGVPLPKVIDFGVAKATGEQRLTEETLVTAFGQFLGTPAYMSPEQAQMGGVDIDTRGDIYSLGVLLYELLSGKLPFEVKDLLKAGLDEMRRMIRETEPPRPSARLTTLSNEELTRVARLRQAEPPRLVGLLRGDLDWIVMKCLEKDRGRRYETANGLAKDLRRYLENEPVEARPPSRLYQFQKLVRRNKLGFAAAIAVVCSLLLGLGVSTALYFKQKAARARADAEANNKRQVAVFLEDMLKGVGPGVALGRDTALLREILDKTMDRVGRDLTNQPAVEADLRITAGAVYGELAMYAQAEKMHRRVVELRSRLFGRESVWVADALNYLGLMLQRQNKLAEAEATQREALAIRRKLLGDRHEYIANSLNDIAIVLYDQGKMDEAEKMLREALAMRRNLLGNNHLDVALVLNNLGASLVQLGRFTEAEAAQREALAIRRRLLEAGHPKLAESFSNLASALLAQGRMAEAEPLEREAVEIFRKVLGEDHPNVSQCLNYLGSILRAEGKLHEASQAHRAAFELRKKNLGETNLSVAGSLTDMALVAVQLGQWETAEKWHRLALALRLQLAGTNHPIVATSQEHLARLLLNQGRAPEAEPLARDCLAIRESKIPDGWETFSARSLLGAIHAGQGHPGPAEPLLLTGFEGLKQREGKIPRGGFLRIEEAMGRLARLYNSTGQFDKAADWDRKLIEARHRRLRRKVEALREAAQNEDPQTLNELAWALATALVPEVRDGVGAVNFAERAVGRTGRKDPRILATLAAAWAEVGDFEKAVTIQAEVLELTGAERPGEVAQNALRFYQARAAWRDFETPASDFRNQLMPTDLEALCRDEVEFRRKQFPGSSQMWIGPVRRLAEVLLIEHQPRAAERLFAEALPPGLEAEPGSAAMIQERASFMARRADWARATADAQKLVELDPTNKWALLRLPLLILAGGDTAGYRTECEKRLNHAGKFTTQGTSAELARLLLVQPLPPGAWPTVSGWADSALKESAYPEAKALAQFAKGLLEYREGHAASAIEWLGKALAAAEAEYSDKLVLQIRTVLAMAHHQLNASDLAHAEFGTCIDLARSALPSPASGDLGPDWAEWVVAQTLIREAKTLTGWKD